ncbi:MAG: hypothetical protein KDI03_23030, partial [Anaerolineae bacterium]|nr:hypothetical protein [Anaerolineae bacterium]
VETVTVGVGAAVDSGRFVAVADSAVDVGGATVGVGDGVDVGVDVGVDAQAVTKTAARMSTVI